MFTKAIYTKNGDVVTITEQEAAGLMNALQAGEKWIVVQGEMYSADTIARVGNHTMTTEIKRMAEADSERKLELSGGRSIIDAKRELKKKMAIERIAGKEVEQIESGMTAEESESGKAEYWIDENGQKMYS
jgi:hypothetical protein